MDGVHFMKDRLVKTNILSRQIDHVAAQFTRCCRDQAPQTPDLDRLTQQDTTCDSVLPFSPSRASTAAREIRYEIGNCECAAELPASIPTFVGPRAPYHEPSDQWALEKTTENVLGDENLAKVKTMPISFGLAAKQPVGIGLSKSCPLRF